MLPAAPDGCCAPPRSFLQAQLATVEKWIKRETRRVNSLCIQYYKHTELSFKTMTFIYKTALIPCLFYTLNAFKMCLRHSFCSVKTVTSLLQTHLLRFLQCRFQLGLVSLRLLLQPADLRQQLGLLLSAGFLQGLKCLPVLVQLALLLVQMGASPVQLITAPLKLLGTSDQRLIMCP